MVSQFVSSHSLRLLSDLDFNFPEGTHAVGRLDNHSEGLLLLTTNKKITRLLFESTISHKRTYLVQVNNVVSEENLQRLREGVVIRTGIDATYCTLPCEVSMVVDPKMVCSLPAPIAVYPPYTWLLITLTEGKFHQVRKMLGAIHHRCKRLVRIAIEDITIEDLPAGGIKEIDELEFFTRLKI
jgi:23S rRNA pseudouridine2457 synthase